MLVQLIGAAFILMAAVMLGGAACQDDRAHLRALEVLGAFSRYAFESIEKKRTPKEQIYSSFSDHALLAGYMNTPNELSRDEQTALHAFWNGIGEGDCEAALAHCRRYQVQMEQAIAAARSTQPERERVKRLLPCVAALGLILLLF